jgi:hypothetical protein
MRRTSATVRAGLLGLLLVAPWSAPRGDDEPQATYHEGFETDRPTWRQEETDVEVNLLAHDRSESAAHDGTKSEHFRFTVDGSGSALYYSLSLPKIPVTANLNVRMFVRSTRDGMQLLARVVLPADVDPDTGQPSFVLVPGTVFESAGKWQRLQVDDILTAVERQARILRISTRRKVPLAGAYLERLVINLHGGSGETETFLDDLSIRPVPESAIVAPPVDDAPLTARPDADTPTALATVRMNPGGRLIRDGVDWVPSILDAPGADLAIAHQFGLDTLAVPMDANPEVVKAAVGLGYRLMPRIGPPIREIQVDPKALIARIEAYPFKEAVAFWDLGEQLGAANDPETRKHELENVRALITALHDLPGSTPRLTTGTVAGKIDLFARSGQSLDAFGIDPMYWGTSRSPGEALEYLHQRRNLTARWNSRAPFWGWVDAVPPAAVTANVWGNETPPTWGVSRVMSEQVRAATYLTLMAGFRGIGFRGSRDLTDELGKPVLYEIGLLNAEIDLVQSILALGSDPITKVHAFPPDPKAIIKFDVTGRQGGANNRTSKKATIFPETAKHPSIVAAAINTPDNRGRLVLIADAPGGGQFQMEQSAINDLNVVVPGAPMNAQAWEISLGGVRNLERDHPPGGVRFTIPEFGVATMVLLTTDTAMAERLEAAVRRITPRACDLVIKQARRQYEWVFDINDRLVKDGHTVKQGDELLNESLKYINAAEAALADEDYSGSFDQARRATRPLRMVMHSHFSKGKATLDRSAAEARNTSDGKPATGEKRPDIFIRPTSCPPLLSYGTLVQHYVWCDWIKYGTFGRNLLRGGNFDTATPQRLADAGWTDAGYKDHLGKVTAALRLDDGGYGGKGKTLRLSIRPTDPKSIDSLPPFFDQPLSAIRTPPIAVKARQLVRIRVLAKLPRKLPTGTGGLIVRDTLGGESLQFRTTEAIPDWTEITLFRRSATDGTVSVTLGLAGYGDAYFDNLRIEVLERVDMPGSSSFNDIAGRRPRAPSANPPANAPAESAARPVPRPRR